MTFRPGPFSLAAIGILCSVSIATFAYEAPVVDAAQQQEAVGSGAPASTQAVSQPAAAWQPVTTASAGPGPGPGNNASANASEQSGWQSTGAAPETQIKSQPVVSNKEEATLPSGSEKQRIARLEQQMANYNQMNTPQQVSDLQQKVSQLQGQLEVEQHTVKTLADQQKLFYQDLQQQVTQLAQQKKLSNQQPQMGDNNSGKKQTEFAKKSVAVSKPPTLAEQKSVQEDDDKAQLTKTAQADVTKDTAVAATTASPDSNQEDGMNLLTKKTTSLSDADAYDKAFHALSNKDFKTAQSDFHKYLTNYPKGRFAMNAHFWLGEIGLMHEKYDMALNQFQAVVSQYPHSTKVPDAKLKIAMIRAATGKMDVARQEFKDIRKSYPGTTAAQLASIRLQQLANASTSVSTQ